jgi:uncharacterized protein (TIGR03437 family)
MLKRFLSINLFFVLSAVSQTMLTPGVPAGFYYGPIAPTAVIPAIFNATQGFQVVFPASAIGIMIQLNNATPSMEVDLYTNLGADVAPSGRTIAADHSIVGTDSVKTIVYSPGPSASGTARVVYIAVVSPAATQTAIGGTITATIINAPAGTTVQIPSLGDLYFIDAPSGTSGLGDLAPINDPIQANIPLTAGQTLQFASYGGIVDAAERQTAPPEGESINFNGGDYAGLSAINCPRAGVMGVFVGATHNRSASGAAGIAFTAPILALTNLQPLLNQIFYIGNGLTPQGLPRTITVPAGATRLFLSYADYNLGNNSGSFTVVISVVNPPAAPAAPVGSPTRISSQDDLYYIDAASGTTGLGDLAPFNDPAQANIPLVAGQVLQFTSFGAIVDAAERQTAPPSGESINYNGGNYAGLSAITCPRSGVMGVFVGPTLNRSGSGPAGITFTATIQALTNLQPLLNQIFYIGNGLTPQGTPRTVTVPSGATRLFLSYANYNLGNNTGSFVVTVSPTSGTAPQITPNGILNGGGFANAPVSVGSIVSIFGNNFATATTSASTVPLPTSLAGVTVYFDTTPVPIYFVSANQINVEVPWEFAGATSTMVTVSVNGVSGPGQVLNLAPFQPGIFTYGTNSPVIVDANTGQLVTTAAPTHAGDVLVIYSTGGGIVAGSPVDGAAAPGSPLLYDVFPVTAVFRNNGTEVDAPVSFAGAAPGLIGVTQVNATVPAGLGTGAATLRLQSGSLAASATVPIPIQ